MVADRDRTLRLLQRLAATEVGDRVILGGSSGLFAASDALPALTEDVDVLIDADWLAGHEAEMLEAMEQASLRHRTGSPTFVAGDGTAVDLVGFSHEVSEDHIGGGERIPVMVFDDLSRVVGSERAIVEVPGGGLALSPAALTVVKLMTIRLEKGSKDKIQALLLIDENADDAAYRADLRHVLSRFSEDRIADAVGDARAAQLSLQTRGMADTQSEGYEKLAEAVSRGMEKLESLVEEAS